MDTKKRLSTSTRTQPKRHKETQKMKEYVKSFEKSVGVATITKLTPKWEKAAKHLSELCEDKEVNDRCLLCFILLDQIHDFGDDKNMVDILADRLSQLSGFDFESHYFTNMWENQLLMAWRNLGRVMSIKQSDEGISFIKKTMDEGCWVHDTLGQGNASVVKTIGEHANKRRLFSAHLDGCPGTCETFENTCKSFAEDGGGVNSVEFKIPINMDDNTTDYVTYELAASDTGNCVLNRTFPVQYGDGTTFVMMSKRNKDFIPKVCTCPYGTHEDGLCKQKTDDSKEEPCPFKRVDNIQSQLDREIKSTHTAYDTIQDSIDAISDYKSKHSYTFDTIGFFLTLKTLGDFAQCFEAKVRDCMMITQDSMQFLIGSLLGTKMIKRNKWGYVYVANLSVDLDGQKMTDDQTTELMVNTVKDQPSIEDQEDVLMETEVE